MLIEEDAKIGNLLLPVNPLEDLVVGREIRQMYTGVYINLLKILN